MDLLLFVLNRAIDLKTSIIGPSPPLAPVVEDAQRNDDHFHIVVVGGSASGLAVIKNLATWKNLFPTLAKAWRRVKVTLIDERDRYFHQIGSPRNLLGEDPNFMRQSWTAYDRVFDYVDGNFVHGRVIALDKNLVTLSSGVAVPFNYLVIATGAKYPDPFRPKALEYTESVAEVTEYQKAVQSAERILIIGGGTVGVELAGELAGAKKRVTLVHGQSVLASSVYGTQSSGYYGRSSRSLGTTLLRELRRLGVEVHLDERVDIRQYFSGDDGTTRRFVSETRTLVTSSGKSFESDIQILAIGMGSPNSEFVSTLPHHGVHPHDGEILVDSTLQLISPEYSNMFALGDVAQTGSPKMALFAINFQAPIVAFNICSLMNARLTSRQDPPKASWLVSHRFKLPVIVITIGESHGVLSLLGFSFSGFIGRAAYRVFKPGMLLEEFRHLLLNYRE
ncbi:hypothetical protein BJ742DRAFT_501190 [Cladochytrium replicatum]|nr:hypothetical protein BJ742DRAFT_501190 [Cladochytrium replicatum]